MFTWGENGFGQLGLDTPTDETELQPRLVSTLDNEGVVDIDCGFDHCVALTG